MEPIVSLKNVTKRFGDLVAVDHLCLEVNPGDFLTLLGPSGCGKTTVLRLIAGFEKADSGDIAIAGHRVNDLPPNRRNVNTVFQSYALFPHMNVFDNIAFSMKIKGMNKETITRKVTEALEVVKLGKLGGRRVHELSGGQQQRVAVARAIVAEPLVLLLDEPFSALDFKLRKKMQLELKRLHRRLGITFIFVTHDQSEAISMSNRIVVMNKGRIEQEGTPIQIYEEPENLFVARFVGEINVFDATIVQAEEPSNMVGELDGMRYEMANKRDFKAGDHVKILLRPEDITVEKADPSRTPPFLEGIVDDLIYKGTTYDLIVRLPSGKPVFITEFFDEDAEEMIFASGDRVHLTWYQGWEVVLPDD